MTKQQATRTILVLTRYSLKKDYAPKGLHRGDVVLVIRNDADVEHIVTLRRNGAHSCTCVSRKSCYHITSCKEYHNARIEARKENSMPAQDVVVATPVAIEPVYAMSEAVRQKLAATAKPAPVVAEEPVVEAPKQTYRIISLGKKERYDYVAAIAEKREHKAAILGEIAEIKSRSKKDMMNAALTQNRAFSILK
jgi:hypothetical protein